MKSRIKIVSSLIYAVLLSQIAYAQQGQWTWMSIDEFKLVIYNRWGERIFETSDASVCWDGTYKGEEAPTGAYAYNLFLRQLDGKVLNKTGTLTLLK